MGKPLVVNLFASPGSGKSTMASGLFYRLKQSGVNAELTGEYAKDLTWSRRLHTLNDQLYLLGKQHHRVWRLQDDCDVIISDSPILLGCIYADLHKDNYPQCFYDTVKWAFDRYNNINFLINRVKAYNPKGRTQTEEESTKIHNQVRHLLEKYGVSFVEVNGNDEGLQQIVENTLDLISD